MIPGEHLSDKVETFSNAAVIDCKESPICWAVKNLLDDFIKWEESHRENMDLQSMSSEQESNDIIQEKLDVNHIIEVALKRMDMDPHKSEKVQSNVNTD